MPFINSNITNLVNNITQTGLAYSNRYEVHFGVPKLFNPSVGSINKNGAVVAEHEAIKNMMTNRNMQEALTIRCDSVTVPGRSFSTTPFRYYGPARNMPYEPIYSGEISVSIILSQDLRERTYFELWMDMINNNQNYKFRYYDDYITDMEVVPMTRSDIQTHSFLLEEVYPKAMGDIQLGYDKDNDYLKQDITLAFRKYSINYNNFISESIVRPVGQMTPTKIE